MNPVLFEHNETNFRSQGIGTLDCVSCLVTEERNGIYELVAKVRKESRHFDSIIEGNIIAATHSNKRDRQPFQIYRVKRTLDGFAEIYAEHISYRLNRATVMPFAASSPAEALSLMKTNMVEDTPFSFITDKDGSGTYEIKTPSSVKSALSGTDGSLTDIFGGEYEYDIFTVKYLESRGSDNGVTLRYGKNITELSKDTDITDIYTSVVPFWRGLNDEDEEITVTLPERVVDSAYIDAFPTRRSKPVDLTSQFEEEPTEDQLRGAAVNYINANVRRQLLTTIKTQFIELGITDEYKGRYVTESVDLCDTVTIMYPAVGISDKAQVTKVVYNVLLDRNESIEIGDLKKTLSDLFGNRKTVNILDMRKAAKKAAKDESEKTKEELRQDINDVREDTNDQITQIDQRIMEINNRIDGIVVEPFPVGSIYLSIDDTDPANYFGGTWERISDGKYLISADDLNVDSTGGSLTHFHDYSYELVVKSRMNVPDPNDPNKTVQYPILETAMPTKNRRASSSYVDESPWKYLEYSFNSSQVTVNDKGDIFHEVNTGETENAENKPPYYAVYVWKRTA